MRRRDFILGVGGVSVLAALPAARAQEAGRRYRIAILIQGDGREPVGPVGWRLSLRLRATISQSP
jgi:hypothetical protein